MKASEFIEIVRDDTNELYRMHELSISTNGEQGLLCLNPDKLIEKMNRTDKEILEFYLAEGAQIEDADEYLANLKQ